MIQVMIVDDSPIARRGLRRAIPWTAWGASISGEAADGREALEKAQQLRPDLIITDIRMPEFDGLYLCHELKKHLPDTVHVILSAYDDFHYAQSAIRSGAFDYLLKPIDEEKIRRLQTIVEMIDGTRELQRSFAVTLLRNSWTETLRDCVKNGKVAEVELLLDEDFPDHWFQHIPNHSSVLREWVSRMVHLCQDLAWKHRPDFMTSQGLEPMEPLPNPHLSAVEQRDAVRRMFGQLCSRQKEFGSGSSAAIVKRVRTYLDEHYANDQLTVYWIADYFSISANYLSVIFKQETGSTINQYLTDRRLERARALLRDPDVPIHSIAASVGYADPHYFSKVFKKSEDMTPSAYRQRICGP